MTGTIRGLSNMSNGSVGLGRGFSVENLLARGREENKVRGESFEVIDLGLSMTDGVLVEVMVLVEVLGIFVKELLLVELECILR